MIVGFHAIVILIVNLGFSGYTRVVTVPLRLFAITLAIFFILFNLKHIRLQKLPLFLFIYFSLVYIIRVVYYLYVSEYNTSTSLSKPEYLLYYITYAMVPFLFFIAIRKRVYLDVIYKSFVLSLFGVAILSIYFYIEILYSGVSRIHLARYLGYSTVSPLILSYCSAFLIGLCLHQLIAKNQDKWIYYAGIALGFVPFLLGASRGAVVAVISAVTFLFIFRSNRKAKIALGATFSVMSVLLYLLATLLESGVFTRFLNLGGGSAGIRLDIWIESLYQFLYNPLLGDFVEARNYGGYAHNIILESFAVTGILGGWAILFLVAIGLYYAKNIIVNSPKYGWISILYVQALTYNMFSGAIYMAGWFWGSLGLVVAANYLINGKQIVLKNKNKYKYENSG